jgi:DNA-binding GntR family transcriptional regulator
MKPTLKNRAYHYVLERIENGTYSPGDRLTELRLSAEIGVSRTPVREALNQLASEGMVQLVPHVGAFVKTPERREIEELYELREVLEAHAAAKVAAGSDAGVAAELGRLCRELDAIETTLRETGRSTLDEAQARREMELDLAFHRTIIEAADNDRLGQIVRSFRILDRLFALMETRMTLGDVASTCERHNRVYHAIADGRPDAARTEMAHHIRHSLHETLERLARWKAQSEKHAPHPRLAAASAEGN